MQKAKYANKGAILVLVLLLTSAVISAATVLLSTSDINYKMKHISRRVKKAQYNAEGALLEAYAIALEYIESALGYADDKENFKNAYINFILGNCEDLPENVGLINILKDNSKYFIYNNNNIFIEAEIFHKIDFLQLEIAASCADEKIERKVKMTCHIQIPEDKSSYSIIDPEDLIYIYDWKLES